MVVLFGYVLRTTRITGKASAAKTFEDPAHLPKLLVANIRFIRVLLKINSLFIEN